MDNAGYIALSRQAALFRQMEVIANNVANANTTGYKREAMLFSEYLTGKNSPQQSSFTSDVSTMRDMSQGEFSVTHRDLDAAIDGKGFFEVDTPLGKRYTRVGSFQINADGELVTSQGYKVSSAGGAITFSDDDVSVSIREDGSVFAKRPTGEEEERGTISIVKFENPAKLEKLPNGTYAATDEDAGTPAEVIQDYRVVQGAIENSNVNPTWELTQMIKVSRAVGTTGSMLKDLHELELKAIARIGRQE